MRRVLLAVLVLACVSPAGARRRAAPVSDALCVSWSGPPLLALSPAAQDGYLAQLGAAGWRLLRTDFTWNTIEPTPGHIDFAAYDALVARAARHRVRLLGLLDYGVPWAAAGTPANDDHYPPDDPATFARFAATTARHFRRRVRDWEVWNEPNLLIFWKPSPDAARYATLADAAAQAIHRAVRRATVVTGGLAPTVDFINYGQDWGFLAAAVAADGPLLRAFDAAALHPYSFLQAPPPEVTGNATLGPSLVDQMAHFRDVLDTAGATQLPLWVTELGWHTAPESGALGFPPGVDERDQARYLVRATTLALGAGAERVCWYTMTDYANFLHDKEAAFGLFRYQTDPATQALEPKPAFTAAATFAHTLGRARFARDLRAELALPADAYALSFRDARRRRTIVVLWATRAGIATSLPIRGAVRRARLVPFDGTAATDLGRVRVFPLTLGPDPAYLVLDERS